MSTVAGSDRGPRPSGVEPVPGMKLDLSAAAAELRAGLGAESFEVVLVLGSGLGAAVEEPMIIPFPDLSGMPPAGVSGHSGRWIGGRLERLLRTIIRKLPR